jgi:hypothetical protein
VRWPCSVARWFLSLLQLLLIFLLSKYDWNCLDRREMKSLYSDLFWYSLIFWMRYHSRYRRMTTANVLNTTNNPEMIRGLIFSTRDTVAIEYDIGVNIRGIYGVISTTKQKSVNWIIMICL